MTGFGFFLHVAAFFLASLVLIFGSIAIVFRRELREAWRDRDND